MNVCTEKRESKGNKHGSNSASRKDARYDCTLAMPGYISGGSGLVRKVLALTKDQLEKGAEVDKKREEARITAEMPSDRGDLVQASLQRCIFFLDSKGHVIAASCRNIATHLDKRCAWTRRFQGKGTSVSSCYTAQNYWRCIGAHFSRIDVSDPYLDHLYFSLE